MKYTHHNLFNHFHKRKLNKKAWKSWHLHMVMSFIGSCHDLLLLHVSSTRNFKNTKQNSVTWDFCIAEVWYIKVKCNVDSPVMTV